jgi:hypothetical protein
VLSNNQLFYFCMYFPHNKMQAPILFALNKVDLPERLTIADVVDPIAERFELSSRKVRDLVMMVCGEREKFVCERRKKRRL